MSFLSLQTILLCTYLCRHSSQNNDFSLSRSNCFQSKKYVFSKSQDHVFAALL